VPCLTLRDFVLQCSSLMIFQVSTVLLAPLFATFVFDESCLRFYLAFTPNLHSIMDIWGIGHQGFSAYRPEECSRTLVSELNAVWINLVVIDTFVGPAKSLLLQRYPKVKWLLSSSCAAFIWAKLKCSKEQQPDVDDPYKDALKEALKRQADIVTKLTTMLTFIVFGPLCPLLMVAAPVWAATNHCTNYWLQHQQGPSSIHKQIAIKILGQQPTVLYGICAHFGQWAMVTCIAIDLQFSIGPVVLYAVVCVAELVVLKFYSRRHPTLTNHRGLTEQVELSAIVHSDWNRKILRRVEQEDQSVCSQIQTARSAHK